MQSFEKNDIEDQHPESKNLTPEVKRLGPFYKFVCWCSGVRIYLLEKCPTDYNKYFGIGSIILFTGLMAFISGSYAFYTIFKSTFWSVSFGIFWGLLIFFLDWYIVASIRKENNFIKEFGTAFPRLILSVFLALVITKPLELKIFEREIKQELETLKTDKAINSNVKLFEEFKQADKLEQEIEELQIQINQYEQRRNLLFESVIAEAEGRSATNTIGKGPVYKEKREEFNKADAEFQQIKEQNLPLIEAKREQLIKIEEKRETAADNQLEYIQNYDGLLAQLQALGSLSNKNKFINIANWFLVILFIIIESSPILVKLMAKKGPYDELFELEEFKQSNKLHLQKAEIENQTYQKISEQNIYTQAEEQLKADITNEYAKKMKESINKITKTQITSWEKNAIQKSKSGKPGNIIGKIKFPKF